VDLLSHVVWGTGGKRGPRREIVMGIITGALCALAGVTGLLLPQPGGT
jgi:hypothetical protein